MRPPHGLGVCAAEAESPKNARFQGSLTPYPPRKNRSWSVLRGRFFGARFLFLLPRRLLAAGRLGDHVPLHVDDEQGGVRAVLECRHESLVKSFLLSGLGGARLLRLRSVSAVSRAGFRAGDGGKVHFWADLSIISIAVCRGEQPRGVTDRRGRPLAGIRRRISASHPVQDQPAATPIHNVVTRKYVNWNLISTI